MACVVFFIGSCHHNLILPLHWDENGEMLTIGRKLYLSLTLVFNVVFFGVNVLKDMLRYLFAELALHL